MKIRCDKQKRPSHRLDAHGDEQIRKAYRIGIENICIGAAVCDST